MKEAKENGQQEQLKDLCSMLVQPNDSMLVQLIVNSLSATIVQLST